VRVCVLGGGRREDPITVTSGQYVANRKTM
jgi:hypothetical protein